MIRLNIWALMCILGGMWIGSHVSLDYLIIGGVCLMGVLTFRSVIRLITK